MTEEQVFLTALEQPTEADRNAYLDTACGGNAGFRRQVEELLAAHFRSGEFLDQPVGEQLRGGTTNDVVAETIYAPATQGDEAVASEKDQDDELDLHFLEPGTRPDSLGRIGHYEVLEVLGKGGFGIVFRAFDDVLQRVVALKVLAPALAATSPARKRFLREARASAKVRHDNVVQVYAVEEQPLPYLAMEFIPGETLQKRLDRKGPLEVTEIVSLSRQIAAGLSAAHETGLIHRDIKPGNVLIEGGAQNRVKITDFGLARAADDASMTQSGMVAGTPMYMAPEQAKGETLDQRADLFSLGSVMYVMAAGRPPFRAATTFAVLKRVVEEAPRPIRDLIPETPQWLCDIIAKLHAKDPKDRFQSAREVADVLADCESQLKQNSRVQDLSRIPRTQRQPMSHQKTLLIATAIFALPLIALAVTESIGLTHLLLGRPAVNQPIQMGIESVPVVAAEIPNAEGWVQLFNGKDLTGWKTHPEQPGKWTVAGGELVGRDDTSHLFTDRGDYRNFHLRVEAKMNFTGDSGILFRSEYGLSNISKATGKKYPRGYEAQIRLNYDEFIVPVTGSLANLWSIKQTSTKPDQWQLLEIIAVGNHIVIKVDGQTTVDFTDSEDRYQGGHIALQCGGGGSETRVHFRKIEIKELPPAGGSSPGISKRQFASDEWIDVIPLIDPQLDRWNIAQTGKNEWRIDNGELITGYADDKPCKLLLPLDSDWRAFECEVEFTRRAGTAGFNLNIPTAKGECPVVLNPPNVPGIWLGRRGGGVSLNDTTELKTDQRTTLRLQVRPEQNEDHLTLSVDGVEAGNWQGDRTSISTVSNEGYPHARRMSLWVHGGGNEFVFHKIRVRMLDGGTAETLRPIANDLRNQSSSPSTFKNTLGMEFVLVPKGKSWVGGGKDKLGDKEVEIPADFYLGKYEVTQEEWEKIMGENPSFFSRTGEGKDAVKDITDADLKRFPVDNVSWDNCQLFVAKLNRLEKETGWVYRLPKKAEWEYACRGGGGRPALEYGFDYYLDQPTNAVLPDQANFKSGVKVLNRTCMVGSYKPNRLGLYDMHGNVWEWCHDEVIDKGISKRLPLGGSWSDESFNGKASFRRTPHSPSARHNTQGLRLARVPSGVPSPEAKTPPVAADVLKDAVLLMDFEKDTFYEKGGKTYVRDLSGNGNDGLCENVEFSPDGKAGGGLLCKEGEGRLRLAKSLILRQPNYTITAWCRWDETTGPVLGRSLYRTCLPNLTQTVFEMSIPPERSVHVNAWNRDLLPKYWKDARISSGAVPAGWFFVAVALTDGEVDKGKLRIVIDDKIQSRTSQMVATNDSPVDLVGNNMAGAVIDELTVFQRALSDEEIAAVRALGLKGTSLDPGKPTPISVAEEQ